MERPRERPLVSDFEDPGFAAYFEDVAGAFDGTIRGGALVVESDDAPGSCSLRTAVLIGDDTRANYVDLAVDLAFVEDVGDRMHGAGLVAKYRSGNAPAFLAILVGNAGYEIVAFVDGGIPQRIGGSTDVPAKETVRVAVREADGGATFYLDGERVGGLSDSRIDGEAMGLIVCGPGRFVFDNWGQNTRDDIGVVAARTPTPPPVVSETPAGPGSGPPPLPVAEWYVAHEGAALGPITLPELRARLADGRSAADALVWREGMTDWRPANEALP